VVHESAIGAFAAADRRQKEGNAHQEDGSLATPQHPEQASIEQARKEF